MRTVPTWMMAVLYACVLVGLLWVAIYPLIPVPRLLEQTADGSPLALIRGHRTTVPFHLAWSSEGWRWGAAPLRLAGFALVGLSLLLGWRRRSVASTAHAARFRWITTLLLAGGGAWLFWWGRIPVPVMLTYGDTIALIRQIAEATWVFPAEPLMMHLFNGMSRSLTALRGSADGVLAGQTTAVLCGVAYLLALWALALERARPRLDAVLLFAAFALTGTMTQFFGYIETTLLQTAALAAFLASIAWTLRAQESSRRHLGLLATHVSLGVLLCAHAAGVALVPAWLVLWGILMRRARRQGQVRDLLSWRPVAGVIVAVVVPWVLLVWMPFYAHGSFGNSAGGGDGFRFVPWDIDSARRSSDYVYYGMLSRLHAIDISAALLTAAPWAVVQMIGAFVLRRRLAQDWQRSDDALHLVLLVAAAGSTSIVLLWDFDFGMWGDWNIVTCYLLPLHVYGWTVFTDALRQCTHSRSWQLTVVLPLLWVQCALSLGLWLQFHPPGVR